MSVFNGTWKIDIARSRKWDSTTGGYVPDEVGEEIITLKIAVLIVRILLGAGFFVFGLNIVYPFMTTPPPPASPRS